MCAKGTQECAEEVGAFTQLGNFVIISKNTALQATASDWHALTPEWQLHWFRTSIWHLDCDD